MEKKYYFYTNILAWGLVLFLICNHVFGWTTPILDPPEGDLSAPLNISSTAQTKTGNLTIGGDLITQGVLKLGQFTTENAPSGTEGALYFDTTENITKIYSSSAWSELGGGEAGLLPTYTTADRDALSPTAGLQIYNTTENNVQVYSQTAWKTVGAKLALAATCSLDGDCDSTHCVDGVCCDTVCSGTCEDCNVAGFLGTCTDVASDCTGNCDVCSSGNCAASASLCTGNCDVCSGSGTAYNCAASNALCSNSASSCYCSGSGTAFNCQSCPDTYGVCGHPTCSSYSCGNAYDNGVQCATCKACSSGNCISAVTTNWGAGTFGCAAGATNDPNRCYGGSCINCGGWGYGGYCWYSGVVGDMQSKNDICSARGGVNPSSCDWTNKFPGCPVCAHFFPSYVGCDESSAGPLYHPGSPYGECAYDDYNWAGSQCTHTSELCAHIAACNR